MGDINLLPEDLRQTPRHHRPVKGGIEYSGGQTLPPPLPPPATPSAPKPVPPTKPREPFAEWWKRRRAKALQHPPMPPETVHESSEHDAPKKTHDPVQMNLAQPSQPSTEERRTAAMSATLAAPQLVRAMPRPPKQAHARTQRQLSPGQPMPASDRDAVNLLPDQLVAELHPRNRFRGLVVTTLSACVVVLLVYGGMNMYQQKIVGETRRVEDEIAAVDLTIASYAQLQLKAQDIDRQLTGLETVLDGHILWAPFLSTIEKLTLPTVYYTSVSGSAASGSFTFDAVAADYDQIDPQVRVFRNGALVRSVVVSSAHEVAVDDADSTTSKRAVAFTMSVEFDPQLFHTSLPE